VIHPNLHFISFLSFS